MMIRCAHAIAILVFLSATSACSTFSLIQPQSPVDLYDLSPTTSLSEGAVLADLHLAVDEPLSARAIDNDRITLKRSVHDIQYFKGARWSDRVPRMLQTHMVDAFAKSGRVASIGRKAGGVVADYEIKGELIGFQAEYFVSDDGKSRSTNTPTVHVRLALKVVRKASSRIIATQQFDVRVPSKANRMDVIVSAFDEAVGEIFSESVDWALEIADADREAHSPRLSSRKEVKEEVSDEEGSAEVTNGAAKDEIDPSSI